MALRRVLTFPSLMQVAEQHLQQVRAGLQQLASRLQGAAVMQPPMDPLALTALLTVMAPGGTGSLATSPHPVIKVSLAQACSVSIMHGMR